MQKAKTAYSSNEEAKANRFTIKCILITLLFSGVVLLLDLVNIFIVDLELVAIAFSGTCACFVIIFGIVRIVGDDKWWIKYMLIFATVVITTIMGVMLTYHVVLISILPILYACQYSDRKVAVFSYILSVISIFIIVMAGYYLGVCDANMVCLTNGVMGKYVDEASGLVDFGVLNPNPWITLPLFYVLPRCMILLVIWPVIQQISQCMHEQAVREQEFRHLSETDEMTQLYNRNKYLDMVANYYPSVERIGVIFWDVNGLKETNDNKGHEKGDLLISGIAQTIHQSVRVKDYVYRIGGDEFVAVLENVDLETVSDIVDRWKGCLEFANKKSRITLSASVGYAAGAGSEIEQVVKRADAMMYEEKQKNKYHR